MVDIPRSSFIPKEASGLTPGRVRRKRTFHIFGFIATASLVGSLLTVGLVYFLKNSADSQLEVSKQELNKQKNLFNAESIAEVREFDRRLQAAELLIRNHISPLKLFVALEKETKQKIQFTSFQLEHTPALEVLVTLRGTTPEFKTLALQELSFGEDSLLKDIVLSEVSAQDSESKDTGQGRTVDFTLAGVLDSSFLLYDGQSESATQQTAFVETDGALIAIEGEEGVVFGESVLNDSL